MSDFICPLCVLESGKEQETIPRGVKVGYCRDRHIEYFEQMQEYDKRYENYVDRMISVAYYGDPAGEAAAQKRNRDRLLGSNTHRLRLLNYLIAFS